MDFHHHTTSYHRFPTPDPILAQGGPRPPLSVIQILNIVNKEKDEAENCIGPLLDSPMANTPAANGSTATSSTLIPSGTLLLGKTPSILLSFFPQDLSTSSFLSSSKSPPSSSLPPTVYPHSIT